MLEHWRQQRALEAASHWPKIDRQVFLDQELQTQIALAHLGMIVSTPPSEVYKIGSMFMNVTDTLTLRKPYGVEVLGMPGAGKDTMIDKYLEGLWLRNIRHHVYLIQEGARGIKEKFGHLRQENPFQYNLLGGSHTFLEYTEAISKVNSGAYMFVANRGQVDRRVFRRMLFGNGYVNPAIMEDEDEFIYGIENTPVQLGGIIMLMIKPETSFYQRGNDGVEHPIRNLQTLQSLYEQYWRLHSEILDGQIPFRFYQCIDASAPIDEVYTRFEYTMDSALNVHDTLAHALARAFPKEFDQILADKRVGRIPPGTPAEQEWGRRFGGKKVLIVGGDDMDPDEDFHDRSLVEAIRLH